MFSNPIQISEIAREFDLEIIGDSEAKVFGLGSTKRIEPNFLFWAKSPSLFEKIESGTVVCSNDVYKASTVKNGINILLTKENSRLIFSKIINNYFVPDIFNDNTNYVNEFRKNNAIQIGENVFIGKGVKIGNGTVIQNNVVIRQMVSIGENCLIKDNTTLGTEGLSHDYDQVHDLYIKLPQIGGVLIEDFVEIGPNSTVRRSALDNTIIGRGTRIGSLCNIGHNVIIGKNCTFISHCVAGGSSIYEDNVFVGMNASIKNGLNIGKNVTIGQGSVVLKHIPENEIWVGNPAKKMLK